MSNSPHINAEQCQQLLDASPANAASPELLQHLEHCPGCREMLERSAADASWWSGVNELTGVDWQKTLPAAIECPLSGNSDAFDERGPRSNWTELLDPPGHPEFLGQLGPFEIERILGQGGMGIVFKGFDRELHRPVAIKLMSPHLAHNATARRRFEREARAAAAVVHPNVIPIFGVSQSKGQPLLVMPLVSGKSLQAHVDQHGPFDTKDVVRIGMQISAGLAAAHQQGLIHRDIKPANILLEQDVSRVVITDFGLARAADELAMTQTGWLAGTPHYMSPEQARGAAIDPRSDLFSLGSVLYFIATGREPFRAERPVAVLHKICNDSPLPARQLNSDIPHTLSDIIERLLEKNPGDRFPSAARVQKLLEEYLAQLQEPNRRFKPIRVTTRRQIRRRWQIAGYLALVAALVPLMIVAQSFVQSNGARGTVGAPAAANESMPRSPLPIQSELGGLLSPDEFDRLSRQLEQELEDFARRYEYRSAPGPEIPRGPIPDSRTPESSILHDNLRDDPPGNDPSPPDAPREAGALEADRAADLQLTKIVLETLRF